MPRSGSAGASRGLLAALLALLVVASLPAAGLAVSGDTGVAVGDGPPGDEALLASDATQQQAQPIDSCTVITEPGRYELTADVANASADVCLHVRASDVVLDGNGHTVAGASDENSTGVFVYNGSDPEDSPRGAPLSNVTVQDFRVTDWGYGVRVGTVSDGGSDVTVRNVVARDNARDGVHMWFIGSPVIENVTSVGNGEGLYLREVQRGTVRELNVSNNVEYGIHLSDVTTRTNFTDLTVTRNGDGTERSGGIYLSTDVGGNVFEDAHVANNDGVGVRSSDSGNNVFRNSTVESNTGDGFFSDGAFSERLQNVTLRNNSGDEIDGESGSYDADRLELGNVATLSFSDEPIVLDVASPTELPSPPGTPVSSSGVRISNVEDGVTMSFPVQASSSSVVLWRYDGSEWTRVPNTTVDRSAETVSGNVSANGVVVPLDSTGRDDGENGTGVTGTDAVFEILSTDEDADFQYQFTVDGTVEPTQTEDVSADADDAITENEDGTVTVTGSTGDGAGDAFLVSGEVLDFTLTGAERGYRLVFDGDDVTPQLAPISDGGDDTTTPPTDGEPADGTGVSGTDAVFEILSTEEDADFEYEFTVAGTVEPTQTEDVSADAGDTVVENPDGTVTVSGSTGSAAGDVFLISGEILEFSLTGADEGYRLVFDGEDVTDRLAPPGDDDGDATTTTTPEPTPTTEQPPTTTEEPATTTEEPTTTEQPTTTTTQSTTTTTERPPATTTETPTTTEEPTDGTGVEGTDVVFEILSTDEDSEFEYEFTVEGSVEQATTEDVSADADDAIVENGDGTVTVTGSTGSGAGDAFRVTGEILEFSLSGAAEGYRLVFAGEDVTDRLAPRAAE